MNAGATNVLLFIYGTLKRGHSHHRLMGAAVPLPPDCWQTSDGHTLVDAGGYPGMVGMPGSSGVEGEVYAVPAETLPTLDDYEGVAEELYVRHTLEVYPQGDVNSGRSGLRVHAYFFVPPPDRSLGDFPVVGRKWTRAHEQSS